MVPLATRLHAPRVNDRALDRGTGLHQQRGARTDGDVACRCKPLPMIRASRSPEVSVIFVTSSPAPASSVPPENMSAPSVAPLVIPSRPNTVPPPATPPEATISEPPASITAPVSEPPVATISVAPLPIVVLLAPPAGADHQCVDPVLGQAVAGNQVGTAEHCDAAGKGRCVDLRRRAGPAACRQRVSVRCRRRAAWGYPTRPPPETITRAMPPAWIVSPFAVAPCAEYDGAT